jgi:hypothetical protein
MPRPEMAHQVTAQREHDLVHNVVRNRTNRVRTRPPFECIALLLQGGDALMFALKAVSDVQTNKVVRPLPIGVAVERSAFARDCDFKMASGCRVRPRTSGGGGRSVWPADRAPRRRASASSNSPRISSSMNARARARISLSIGSNQLSKRSTAFSDAGCKESGFVVVLVMAWSPVRRFNAG